MPGWFIDMLSATVMVENSNGVIPAAASPCLAAATCGASDIAHGVIVPPVETRPAKGWAIALSSWPIARMKARCGARSSPSTMAREGSDRLMQPP